MLRETTGDILDADCEALVNPVNTVGIMGTGLALQFKQKYPDMFIEYRTACRRGDLRPGETMVHFITRRENSQKIISFATKRDWRKPSQIEWIDTRLVSLRNTIDTLMIRSLAIPALGCGLGGLQWGAVRSLIVSRLGDLTADVLLYSPYS